MFKVMIVDDMEIARIELKRLKLWGEKSGFIISMEAKNGDEALDKLRESPADMIITDIKMPVIDGIELLRNIVESKLCSCVVLLSDFSEFSYAKQGIVLGAFDYISKPVKEEELANLLQRAAKFIENKKKEEERIKMLEETALDKAVLSFSTVYIPKLITAVENCTDPLPDAVRMADIAVSDYRNDPVKLQSILRNAMLQIVDGFIERNAWLQKFLNSKEFTDLDFYKSGELQDIKNLFLQSIQKLHSICNKLRCGIHDGGIAKDVCSFILNNIDGDLSLSIVAEKLYMNKNYISEAFRQKTGKAFVEYLTEVKVERAKILIAVEGLKAYKAAEVLGYNDAEYFSKIFKKYTGMSPTEFRQLN